MTAHRFHGGLRLDGHGAESTRGPIRACPLPDVLILPLAARHGTEREPCTQPGDRVRRGQTLALAPEGDAAPLLAPASGRILALETREFADGWLRSGPCLLLAPEADDDGMRLPPLHPSGTDPAALRLRLHEAGVVGLGGGGFPAAHKLHGQIACVILNGAECEPWISCDDALLREQAGAVVGGAEVLYRAAGAAGARIAIEDDMSVAGAALEQALARFPDCAISLVRLPARYPQGSERQLILALTGHEVPRRGRPADLGVLVFNVGTAFAAWRAVTQGEPVLSRIVTVAGPGIVAPGNWEVALGTPVAHLVAQAGGYGPGADRLMLGGPLTGLALPHDAMPILATSQCVLALDAAAPVRTLPCIRCGECARVCPARLLPQQLHWHLQADAMARAAENGLMDCIECGACDVVCPSAIPLSSQFRRGRQEWQALQAERDAAAAARARHAARSARLAGEAEARERALDQKRASASSPDAVQAALDRARARRRPGGAAP